MSNQAATSNILTVLEKIQQEKELSNDEVLSILSILTPADPQVRRILYAAFCAVQGGDEDIASLYSNCDRWMDEERS